jgi:phosphomannomutase/phosphomannomutase/phosphoglucomutase
MSGLSCFKTYDVRGIIGTEIDEEIAYRVGRAFAEHLDARRIVVGSDARLSGESLKKALAKGLMDAGADVIDIGLSGTEEMYFASFFLGLDGGIEVTASHNPVNYNGFKFIGPGARPLGPVDAFSAIRKLAEAAAFKKVGRRGTLSTTSILPSYVDHLLRLVDSKRFRPLRLVVDSGNGAAGHVVDALEERFKVLSVPVEFVKVNHEPDGNFPNGVPNPLLPERRAVTSKAVRDHHADMGIAWDGDFDRCFLYDEHGQFVSGYYVSGLLAAHFLDKFPSATIVCDSRLHWNTLDIIARDKGVPVMSRAGHVFFKDKMRQHDAIYGGEISAHHYFRDFACCDSGMIPWLLVAEHVSVTGKPLSDLVSSRAAQFACSEEVNFEVHNPASVMASVCEAYKAGAKKIDRIDGIGIEFEKWRFSLRPSNTESLLRLNIEARADSKLVAEKLLEIGNLIHCHSELGESQLPFARSL